MNSRELREAIRRKYAWPGGYPLALMMLDGESICMDCARKEYRLIARANRDGAEEQWCPVAVYINWEPSRPAETCAHCNKELEVAYPDDPTDTPKGAV